MDNMDNLGGVSSVLDELFEPAVAVRGRLIVYFNGAAAAQLPWDCPELPAPAAEILGGELLELEPGGRMRLELNGLSYNVRAVSAGGARVFLFQHSLRDAPLDVGQDPVNAELLGLLFSLSSSIAELGGVRCMTAENDRVFESWQRGMLHVSGRLSHVIRACIEKAELKRGRIKVYENISLSAIARRTAETMDFVVNRSCGQRVLWHGGENVLVNSQTYILPRLVLRVIARAAVCAGGNGSVQISTSPRDGGWELVLAASGPNADNERLAGLADSDMNLELISLAVSCHENASYSMTGSREEGFEFRLYFPAQSIVEVNNPPMTKPAAYADVLEELSYWLDDGEFNPRLYDE